MAIDQYDVVIIGSGAGGLAAAVAAKKEGAEKVLVVERDTEPGGILLQCIHNGFGLRTFKEDLPGPLYAQKLANEAVSLGVEFLLDAMVLELTPHLLTAVSGKSGLKNINTRSVVLAMGCRERTRPQINLPGSRPAGIYTAGTAQRWVNIEGYMPGKKFVILGSGDIGMIMARRLTFEGAKVERMLEIMPYVNGLMRNYVQCILDYNISLQFNHTVKRIIGERRVEAVEVAQVDNSWNAIPGTEEIIPCDTLLLSVGLIPENELSRKMGVKLDPVTGGPFVNQDMQTSLPGVFAAGNVVQVYDLVDWVTEAGFVAGRAAARFSIGKCESSRRTIKLLPGNNVRYVIPHYLDKESLLETEQRIQLRVVKPMEERVYVEVTDGDKSISKSVQRYVRPGEMVTIELSGKVYDLIQSTESLTVQITKA
jgi:NADPH-dependent 2,4-dienoyl-CoA reductase/sulfur reductase-like enzyme